MLVRRILEIAFFGFYWICVGLLALKFVYRKLLEQKLKLTKIIGGWPLLALFVFILLIIYVILRYFLIILYAKCKVSEKRALATMKKECRSLESGINSNAGTRSTESLLSDPVSLTNQVNHANCAFGKSVENIAEKNLKSKIRHTKSLEDILKPHEGLNNSTEIKQENIIYDNAVVGSVQNPQFEDPIYAELSESIKHVILKRSKSLENVFEGEKDEVDASVADLLKIYESFYGSQNSMQRNKRPIRKAPPVPTHMKTHSYKNDLALNAKNIARLNSELKTVNEKCQAKKLW